MRAGDLRHAVTFQTIGTTADGMLGHTESWTNTLTTRAAIWPYRSGEALDGLKLTHTVSHKIRVRYNSAITPQQRIKFGSRYFFIEAIVNPDEKNALLDILAWEET